MVFYYRLSGFMHTPPQAQHLPDFELCDLTPKGWGEVFFLDSPLPKGVGGGILS